MNFAEITSLFLTRSSRQSLLALHADHGVSTAASARDRGRFDSIWITHHWTATHVSHLYDEAITAGSDHAIVAADLTLTHPTTPDGALASL
jgi:hypothetical protein